MSEKAEIKAGTAVLEAPIVVGTENEHAIDIQQLRAKTGLVTLDPAFMNTASTKSAITFLDGEQGHPALPRHPDRAARREVDLRRDRVPAHLRQPAERDRARSSSPTLLTRHSLHPRGHEALLRRLPGHRAPDGDPVGDGRVAVELLPGRARRREQREQVDITIARLLSKVRTIAAFAYKKSIGQPFVYPKNSPQLLRELPQHDVLGPGRALRGRPGAREGAEPAPHPARRSRAELLDVDGAHGRQRARRTSSPRSRAGICALWGPLHGGANQEVLEMLEAIHADGGDVEEVRRRWRRTRTADFTPDGLRPPRLQELRPAREDHQGRGRQGARQARQQRTRCSTSPRRSKRPRSRTATSSSASSTRTSTSTRASSTARWASRRTCSRCCSRSAACPAGSPTGRR